jgi:uncharacterized protein (DUF362 family)
MKKQIKVSLVKSGGHFKGVQNSLSLLKKDLKKALSKMSSLVIKVNFVDTRVELATTPLKAVEGFIDFILPFFKGEIIIAEGATWGVKIDAFQKYGFTKLAKKNPQVKILDLREDELVEKKIKYPEGEVVLPFSKTVLEAPFLVSITRPKTHTIVIVTLGIKNVLVGVVQGYRMRLKIHKGKFIHNIMTTIAKDAYPDLVILDGTVGMEGDGPVKKGTKIKAGWALASLDALAADSLATYLMGFDVNDIGYLNLLKEKGLGLLYPNKKIQILGEEPKKLITPFRPPKTFEKRKKWK